MVNVDIPDTLEYTAQIIAEYGGVKQAARALGVSRSLIYHRARKYGLTPSTSKGAVEFVDRNEPCEDIDALFDAMERLQEVKRSMESKQNTATVNINDDRPIGLVGWGDWHLGDVGMDIAAFKRDVQTICDTDGLYYVGLGDYKNNVIEGRPKGSQFEEIVRPGLQDMLALHIAEQTKDKAIALVRGCHDDFDKQASDRDFVAAMAEKADCINLWHGGLLTINVNGAVYEIRARHKFYGESRLNKTNTFRVQIDAEGPCDIVFRAHLHFPDLYHTNKQGREVVCMRSGSYKHEDEYGQKIGGYSGLEGAPLTVLYPKSKHMVPFKYMQDGLAYLAMVRG